MKALRRGKTAFLKMTFNGRGPRLAVIPVTKITERREEI